MKTILYFILKVAKPVWHKNVRRSHVRRHNASIGRLGAGERKTL